MGMYWLIDLKSLRTELTSGTGCNVRISNLTSRSITAVFWLSSTVLHMLALSSNKISLCGRKMTIEVPCLLFFKLQLPLETTRISFPESPEAHHVYLILSGSRANRELDNPNLHVDL